MDRIEKILLILCFFILAAGLVYIQQPSLAMVIIISDLVIVAAAVKCLSASAQWIPYLFLRLVVTLGFALLLFGGLLISKPSLLEGGSVEDVGRVLVDYGEVSFFLLFAMVLIGISIPSWENQ
jgi:hypothetical protein